MAQAIVDPAELRRFAQNLKRFNGEMQTQIAGLHGQMVALGNSWRDQEHHKFIENFEQEMKILDKFMKNAEDHIPFLLRKAERVEQYTQQR